MHLTARPAPRQPALDALVSAQAGATLAGLPLPYIHALIRSGAVRVERINRQDYLSLTELERVAAREGRS